jgi:hypothetical protein
LQRPLLQLVARQRHAQLAGRPRRRAHAGQHLQHARRQLRRHAPALKAEKNQLLGKGNLQRGERADAPMPAMLRRAEQIDTEGFDVAEWEHPEMAGMVKAVDAYPDDGPAGGQPRHRRRRPAGHAGRGPARGGARLAAVDRRL